MGDRRYKVVLQRGTLRPACVLLQAAMGGDSAITHEWDSDDWIVSPDVLAEGGGAVMALVTRDEARELARRCVELREDRPDPKEPS